MPLSCLSLPFPSVLDLEKVGTMCVSASIIIIPYLSLPQLTHIGKEVNCLRKVDGDVGKAAKQLVRSWKQLLTEASGESGEGEREEEGRGGRDGRERHRDHVPSQPSCSRLAAPPPPRLSPCEMSTLGHSLCNGYIVPVAPLPWRGEDTAVPGALPAEPSPQKKRKGRGFILTRLR